MGRSYYAYGTSTGWERPGRTFPILRSRDLRRWRPAGDALGREPAWSDGHLWAPSVLAARGRYFMYYSAGRRGDDVHCLGVATAKRPHRSTRRPLGPYRDSKANPVPRGGAGLVAPGGGSVVKGRRGRSWLAFHAWTGLPDYEKGGSRTLRVAPVSWRGGVPRPRLRR